MRRDAIDPRRLEGVLPATEWLRLVPGVAAIVWSIAVEPGDGLSFVAGQDDGTIVRQRLDVRGSLESARLQPQSPALTGHLVGMYRLALDPTGTLIAGAGQDGLVSLWQARNPSDVARRDTPVRAMQVLDGATTTSVLFADGVLLRIPLEAGGEPHAVVFDLAQIAGREVATRVGVPVVRAATDFVSAIGPGAGRLATGNDAGILGLWDAAAATPLDRIRAHDRAITSVAVSPDGRSLASGDEAGIVRLWDISRDTLREPIASFTAPRGLPIRDLLFHPDGQQVVVGGCGVPFIRTTVDCAQGAIYLLDLTQQPLRVRTLVGTTGFVSSLAINPMDGQQLAAGSIDGAISVFDLACVDPCFPSQTRRVERDDIVALRYSFDGTRLAVGALRDVYVYETRAMQLFGDHFRGQLGTIVDLAFTSDGRALLSASMDGTIVRHELDPGELAQRACRVADRALTEREARIYLGDGAATTACAAP